jgi:hypothetical protein
MEVVVPPSHNPLSQVVLSMILISSNDRSTLLGSSQHLIDVDAEMESDA